MSDPNRSLDELARKASAGDGAAFDALVRRCYPLLHRWALVATAEPDEADDVTQDTLLKVQRSLPDYRGDAPFPTWLYRVLRSVVLDRARSEGSRQARRRDAATRSSLGSKGTLDPDPHGRLVHRIESQRLTARVRRFLDDLPARQRQVFDLVDLQGFEPGEVSEMLELSPGTIRAHLFRARRRLRERLVADPAVDRKGSP